MFKAAIITASDKGYAKEREDVSGSVVKGILLENQYEIFDYIILPDDREMLSQRCWNIAAKAWI